MTTDSSQPTTRLISLCSVAEVRQGEVIKVEKDGFTLAVFHLGNRFYVTDDHCTHGPGSLSEGEIEGDVIVCNFHNGAFHIPTGNVDRRPCTTSVRTYGVHIVNHQVCIDPGAQVG